MRGGNEGCETWIMVKRGKRGNERINSRRMRLVE